MARPAITPVTAPTREDLRNLIHSTVDQAIAPLTAAMCVTAMAIPAPPSAANWLPPLNPNQPTHSIAAPAAAMPGLCGGWIWAGKPRRRPTMLATTKADVPALTCTTTPPAKSIIPSSWSHPPPHTQWQNGRSVSTPEAPNLGGSGSAGPRPGLSHMTV